MTECELLRILESFYGEFEVIVDLTRKRAKECQAIMHEGDKLSEHIARSIFPQEV